MKFLTFKECVDWCSIHGVTSTFNEIGPKLQSPPYHFATFRHPVDSSKKVWLARFLYSLVESSPELLIWLAEWDVWPSCQHMPLFTRFREAFDGHRSPDEAPGQLLTSNEAADAVSIIAVSLLFFWNCHVLCSSGNDAVFVSHDEFGWFASRNESLANSVAARLKDALDPSEVQANKSA
jgi:hypothetical protein